MFAKRRKKRVLFFCKHNSCRSQIAEAFLRQMAGDRYEVSSAGLYPEPIHYLVDRVMQEAGISIAGQTSKSIHLFMNRSPFDHIIIVCEEGEAECPTLVPLAIHVDRWPFPDPAMVAGDPNAIAEAFRRTRDEIKAKIAAWLDKQE